MVVGLSPPCGPELAMRTECKVCFPPLAPPGWATALAGDSGCCDPGLRPVGGSALPDLLPKPWRAEVSLGLSLLNYSNRQSIL